MQISAQDGGEGEDLSLRMAKVDSDDEMAGILWGDGAPFGASNSKAKAVDETPDSSPSKAPKNKGRTGLPKRPRKSSPGKADQQQTPSTGAGPSSSAASASIWSGMLPSGLQVQGPKDKKIKNEAREMEKGEAVILQVQQLRCSLEDAEQVQKLSLSKVRSLCEKVDARLSEDLIAMYLDWVRLSGHDSRPAKVWEGLKVAKETTSLAADFIEALHDEEAVPATLSARASALRRETGINLPKNVNLILCRKGAEELLMKKQWQAVCEFMDPAFKKSFPDGITSLIPETDGEPPDGSDARPVLEDTLFEFQTGCLVSCVTNLFMRPVSGQDEKEKAMNLQAAIEDVGSFLEALTCSSLARSLASTPKASLADEFAKLLTLVRAAVAIPADNAEIDADVFTQSNCDALDSAKAHFAKSRGSPWYASLTMSAVGIEVSGRVGKVLQQVRSDAMLAGDIEAAAICSRSFKPFTVEALLKENLEISVPSTNKFADMVGKWLMFADKASTTLKKQRAAAAHAKEVETKVVELMNVLEEIAKKKFTLNFQRLDDDMVKFIKGAAGEAEASVSNLVAQMAVYQPLAKVPLLKLLGKRLSEQLECKVQDVVKFASAIKEAFSFIVVMVTKPEINEEMLAEQSLATVFGMFFDEKLRARIGQSLPWFSNALKQLQAAMIIAVCRWLQETSSTCKVFISELLETEADVQKSLCSRVLGDLSSVLLDAAAAETQDCKQDQDQNLPFIFHSYVKFIGKDVIDLGEGRKLHAGFLGCSAAILRNARYIAVVKDSMSEARKMISLKDALSAFAKASKDKNEYAWETRASKMKSSRIIFSKIVKVSGHAQRWREHDWGAHGHSRVLQEAHKRPQR